MKSETIFYRFIVLTRSDHSPSGPLDIGDELRITWNGATNPTVVVVRPGRVRRALRRAAIRTLRPPSDGPNAGTYCGEPITADRRVRL